MDTNSMRCLINSISRYIHLVSCQTLKPIPCQNDYTTVAGSLKLLKPLLDEVADYKISSDETLYKECEELDMAINEAREFFEGWCPKLSKISYSIQSERLLMNIQRSSLEICTVLERLLHSSPSSLSLSAVQHCVQELKYLELERISGLVEDALRIQNKGTVPCRDHLLKIVELLGLTSSQELLKEYVALEEEKMNAQVNKKKWESNQINQIMDIFSHIRSCVLKLDHLKAINGVPIPPYFRCPLSLELMMDPVIVASGQTYEMASIQKWLDHGLTICPKTHQSLSHKNLIPNYTVKALIANWCDEHNIRLFNASECTNINSDPPFKSPQYFTHIDSFHSSHNNSNSPSRSSREIGNGLEKQRVDTSCRLDKEASDAHKSRDTVKLDQLLITSASPQNYESRLDIICTDSFHSSLSNSPSRSCKEVGNGLEKQRVDNTSLQSEELSNARKSKDTEKFDRFFITSAPSVNNASPRDFICSDSFHSSHSNSSSRSSTDAGSGLEKQRANMSSQFDEEVFHAHKSGDTIRLEPPPPKQSYLCSVDNIPTALTELSLISDKNENANDFSGEITSERPASYPNKDVKVSPRLSGKQYSSSPSPRTEMPTNKSFNNPKTTDVLVSNSGSDDLATTSYVGKLVEDLKSQSNEAQTAAAAELRLLAKHNMENRITIRHCGAISPLLSLLYSEAKVTQEHGVTALLNLSINEDNKAMIAEAGAIEPLIHVLKSGNAGAKENSAAALFSLSVLEEYKAKIGRSGAVKALVDLLSSGTLRGKKDATTALFNLSIFHENKARIVQAGAVKYLVEMMDPMTGMVDKAVAVLANLSTISEGRSAVAREGGIPLLVEIVETGSLRGKENAASILLQLCLNNTKYCTLVLQEGAVPPLVALSQSGTPRAKEKAQQLLSHFRSQRDGANGKKK